MLLRNVCAPSWWGIVCRWTVPTGGDSNSSLFLTVRNQPLNNVYLNLVIVLAFHRYKKKESTSNSKRSSASKPTAFQCFFFWTFPFSSTGDTSEPVQENGWWVEDQLPAPPPRWPPLLQEVQVCRSCRGSGESFTLLISWWKFSVMQVMIR